MGQSQMNNPKKLVTYMTFLYCTNDEEKQNKNTIQYVVDTT